MKTNTSIHKLANLAVMVLTVGIIGGAFEFAAHYLDSLIGKDYIRAVVIFIGAISVALTQCILELAYAKLDKINKAWA